MPRPEIQIVSCKDVPLQIIENKGNFTTAIVHFPTEEGCQSKNTSCKVSAHIDHIKSLSESDAKNRRILKTQGVLKFTASISNKRNKRFTWSLPPFPRKHKNNLNRFLTVQLSNDRAVLTWINDYCEATMQITGGRAQQIPVQQAIMNQKIRHDRRRKSDNQIDRYTSGSSCDPQQEE